MNDTEMHAAGDVKQYEPLRSNHPCRGDERHDQVASHPYAA